MHARGMHAREVGFDFPKCFFVVLDAEPGLARMSVLTTAGWAWPRPKHVPKMELVLGADRAFLGTGLDAPRNARVAPRKDPNVPRNMQVPV